MSKIVCIYVELPEDQHIAGLEAKIRRAGYPFITDPAPCFSQSLEECEVRIQGGQRG